MTGRQFAVAWRAPVLAAACTLIAAVLGTWVPWPGAWSTDARMWLWVPLGWVVGGVGLGMRLRSRIDAKEGNS